MRDLRIRWFVIIAVLIASAYNIWPSYKYYFTNVNENLTDSELNSLKTKAINLGLDLQGGMYVLLEAKVPDYSNLDVTGNENIINALIDYKNNAINTIREIIRNRVDEFGVSEPNIQKYGNDRIIVELAGVKDSDRARNLIQRTATLEFSLVFDDKIQNVIDKIDKILIENKSTISSNESEQIELDEVDLKDANSELDEIFSTASQNLDLSSNISLIAKRNANFVIDILT